MTKTPLYRVVEVVMATPGIKRSQLLQQTRTPADWLERAVTYLEAQGLVQERHVKGAGFGQRGYTCYVPHPEATPEKLDALPPKLPASWHPVADDATTAGAPQRPPRAFNQGARCLTCDARIPPQTGGRPRKFCNPECRAQYHEERDTQLGALMHAAPPNTLLEIAYYYVAALLTAHGRLSFPTEGVSNGRMYLDGKPVDVFVVKRGDPDHYRGAADGIKAIVRFDGHATFDPPLAPIKNSPRR